MLPPSHNDIYSLQKEVSHNCLINLIPVLYRTGTVPWDRIMPTLDVELRAAADRLDATARRLVERVLVSNGTGDDGEYGNGQSAEAMAVAVERVVDGIRNNATGNLSYGLVTRRYQELWEKGRQVDGSVEIVLY